MSFSEARISFIAEYYLSPPDIFVGLFFLKKCVFDVTHIHLIKLNRTSNTFSWMLLQKLYIKLY